MKKLMAVATIAACASGCVMTGGYLGAGITARAQGPVSSYVDNSVKQEKVGTAKSTGIICVAYGDASIDAAMKNGNIKKVHHVDYKTMNILGIYGEFITTVHGE